MIFLIIFALGICTIGVSPLETPFYTIKNHIQYNYYK